MSITDEGHYYPKQLNLLKTVCVEPTFTRLCIN